MSKNTAHSSIRTYFIIFGSLGVLTGLTVVLSYLEMSKSSAIVVASLISLTKCSLIAAFFMHLRFEKRGITAMIFTALFLVAVLILAIIPDIGLIQ